MNFDTLSVREEMILLAIISLQPDAYAFAIKKAIKDEVDLALSLGTIHTILYRLENRGLLKSELGGSSDKRGGRSKRLFSVTSRGREIVNQIQAARQQLWSNISPQNLSFE
ncbi:MAG: helix-turn-helix transcriptional regulator [Bacteroidetes bacterium]|nr:helix-turn-helix transcriptional regulator [Bacteroidota bacterium]